MLHINLKLATQSKSLKELIQFLNFDILLGVNGGYFPLIQSQ